MKNLHLALAVSFVILATSGAPAAADENLNCNAYAGMAVSEQEQNQSLKCGFSGGAWSNDFAAHFNWCRLSGTKMADLTREDKARKDALNDCALKPIKAQEACQNYATNAVFIARLAKDSQCGFSGGAWIDDFGAHFNWCLGAAQPARDNERNARINQLNGCLSALHNAKDVACHAYAEAAVLQNEENQKRKCGFAGGRWSNDKQAHFNWCMGATDAQTKDEADIRNVGLRDSCPKQATSYHCWTETKAQFGIPPWKVERICRYD